MLHAAVVSGVEATAYTVPTDQPEADGTMAWDDTTIVVVQVHSGDVVGTGWTYGSAAIAPLVEQSLAPVVTGTSAMSNVATWSAMVRALRNVGRPGLAGMGMSAVDCALWDLKARLVGLPLHQLLGAERDRVPVYGSGGFTTYGRDRLEQQLRGWVEDLGLRRVKIKIGESWGSCVERDLDRVRHARAVVGPEVELFVDANGGYTVGQATRVGQALDDLGVTWFEEPVSSDDLAGLGTVRRAVLADISAGEYGDSLDYFHTMCEAQVLDCLQVDVTRCGGITELLRIAAVAAAAHLEVSGHCAPHQHAPVLAAVPNLRHLEYFHDHVRIERMLFDGIRAPVQGDLAVPSGLPGNGLSFRPDRAEPYRAR